MTPSTVPGVTIELIPLCTLEMTLAEPIVVGDGPSGLRLVYEVLEGAVEGDRLSGKALGSASADWIAVSGSVASVDVRATIGTHDGAVILAQYRGRTVVGGPTMSPHLRCAPVRDR